ncbi:MAG: DUF86 domain-containing protein [Crenarchaeota archaeon]|nr:DUF86 domain-containing protein [Thermoproteota archaeon]
MLKHCIDPDYITKALAEVREAVDELESIVSRPIEEVLKARELRYAMRFCIILIVESLADVAQHVLTRCFSEAPSSYIDAFVKLERVGLLSSSVVKELVSLARLRNLIIHRYWVVDDARIYREARDRGVEIVREAMDLLRRALDD